MTCSTVDTAESVARLDKEQQPAAGELPCTRRWVAPEPFRQSAILTCCFYVRSVRRIPCSTVVKKQCRTCVKSSRARYFFTCS